MSSFLSGDLFNQEAIQYQALKQRERLTVNLLMCLAQAGLPNIKDEVREQSLKCYIRTEDKLKFRNKAYLYLMKVGGGDPSKMIASERQKAAKRKAAAMRQRYTRNDPLVKASTLAAGVGE